MSYSLYETNYVSKAVTFPIAGDVQVTFQTGNDIDAHLPVTVIPPLQFDLTQRYSEAIQPGSVNFTLGGKTYFDRDGSLYTDLDVVTGSATLAGSINYSTGAVTLTSWTSGAANTAVLRSLLTSAGDNLVTGVTFRVPVSPVRPGSLQIIATKNDGGTINVTAGIDGTITGTGVRGTVEYETGVVGVEFGAMVPAAGNEDEPWYDPENVDGANVWKPAFVYADTLRFNAVAYSYLPLDAEVLGLDPVRLPQDGRVPIFRKGGFAVIGHTATHTQTVSNGQTINLGRVRISRIRVVGANGVTINTGYTENLEAGTVTFVDVTGYSQPVTIEDRIEDLLQVSDVQISGQLAFTRPITHDYPVGSFVSSALIAGDLKARVSTVFDQNSWDGTTWEDTPVGPTAVASYNSTLSPIEVKNFGAVSERWALRFTSNTAFQIIGEHVGIIGTGSINTDTDPLNPATGTPYFIVRALGWGTGWVAGNILRLNTVGAQEPVWVVRTVQQGAETVLDDTFELLIRGDVDRP